jgi:hypothetical protein
MIAGGNWWRANEIIIRYLTRQTATRYGTVRLTVKARPRSLVISIAGEPHWLWRAVD